MAPEPPSPEKALIVGVARSPKERWAEAERLEELAGLVVACGAEVFETILQIKEKPDPAFYIGKGKAEEIAEIVREYGLDLVVFDAPLSGSQARNLEEIIKAKVLDRTEVIMDIFALHARTPEAKAQVELAQLEYQASKLKGLWAHLDRPGGGIGTRGPGEKQLETDRRKMAEEIARLKKRLSEIERSKGVQKARRREEFKVTLVGYTNAGKSSVMNALTQAGQTEDEVPFTTLDPLTRRLSFPGLPVAVLLTDTVGFIEDLPPDLVASFKATLDVIRDADLLLHIQDASHPSRDRRADVVEGTLRDIGCDGIPVVQVFNKRDLILTPEACQRLMEDNPDAILVSARTGEGMDELASRVVDALKGAMVKFKALLRGEDMGKLYYRIIALGIIQSEEYLDDGIILQGFIPARHSGLIKGKELQ
ncbi:MAG: GTPase HflX [candidate division WOR-3 bacterium]